MWAGRASCSPHHRADGGRGRPGRCRAGTGSAAPSSAALSGYEVHSGGDRRETCTGPVGHSSRRRTGRGAQTSSTMCSAGYVAHHGCRPQGCLLLANLDMQRVSKYVSCGCHNGCIWLHPVSRNVSSGSIGLALAVRAGRRWAGPQRCDTLAENGTLCGTIRHIPCGPAPWITVAALPTPESLPASFR